MQEDYNGTKSVSAYKIFFYATSDLRVKKGYNYSLSRILRYKSRESWTLLSKYWYRFNGPKKLLHPRNIDWITLQGIGR